jgi:hypothetical protein
MEAGELHAGVVFLILMAGEFRRVYKKGKSTKEQKHKKMTTHTQAPCDTALPCSDFLHITRALSSSQQPKWLLCDHMGIWVCVTVTSR